MNYRDFKEDLMQDKFIGTMLGLAIGDALGMPAEGKDPKLIKQLYGEINGYRQAHDVEAGTTTDDTDMALVVAEHLIESETVNIPQLAIDFINKWAHQVFASKEPKFYGASCYSACQSISERLNEGEDISFVIKTCGVDSAGNGGAMRSQPLGLFFNREEEFDLLKRVAISSTRLTHNNSEACAGAVAIAYAIARLINYMEEIDQKFLDDVADFTSEIHSGTARRIRTTMNTGNYIHNGGRVLESVPAAFYYFVSSPKDFDNTILRAVNAGGDADTIASMAGSLSGAYNGTKVIREQWVNGLKDSDRIIKTAINLYHAQEFEEE